MEANAGELKRRTDRRWLALVVLAGLGLQLLLFPALTEPGYQLLWIASLFLLGAAALYRAWRPRTRSAQAGGAAASTDPAGSLSELRDDLLRWQRLVQTVEHLAGIGFWETAAVGEPIRWSSGALKLLAPLTPTQDLLPWLPAREAETLAGCLARALTHAEAFTCEFTLRPPGGPPRCLRMIGQPQRDSDGKQIGLAGALFDVSPLHSAEQRCQRLIQRLTDISGIASAEALDETQRLERLGALLLHSVGASALVLSDVEVLPPPLRQQWMPKPALAVWGGLEGLGPYLVARANDPMTPAPFAIIEDGQRRLLRCLLIRTGDQRSRLLLLDPRHPPLDEVDDALLSVLLRAFAGLLNRRVDVVAIEALRQQLDDQLLQTSELMGSLSHEVGSPLSGVTNVLRALVDGQFGALDERHRRLLATSASTGQHINELIQDLLDAARLEAGQLSLQRRLCDLGGLAADAVERCKVLAADKQQRLELRERQPCLAHVDPQRGLQMLVQLIGNAIKYTPAGGTVWVSVRRRHDGRSSLSVCDTGVGIRRRARTVIDRPFQREESPYARPGWGLALAMADRIATLHGGRMRIHNRGGRGSRLSIDLPPTPRRMLVEPL